MKEVMGKIFTWLLFLSLLQRSSGVVQYFSVIEEQEPGAFVGNITRRNNFKYYFRGQVDYFRINADHGSIFTTTRIDRETLASDDLKYVVVSSSPVYATEITIKVLDINDNAPKFKLPEVNLEILESVEVGALIPLESATDPDLGQNSVTNYSIISGNTEDKFTIEIIFNLLHLKVKNKLDRELNDSYNLTVSASDNGTTQKYGYVILNITVLDVNDNAPLFHPTTYRADIYENARIGTSLLQINATDQDIGLNGLITYSLKDSTVFAINSSTGLITLKGQLDHETKPSVTLSVQAFDGGNSPLSATATISVTVRDVNDNRPVISVSGLTRLMENTKKNDFLFLEVKDIDFAPVTLRIVSGNKNNLFSLKHFSNGYFFLTMNAVDREQHTNFFLTLRAYDSGHPQLTSDYHLAIDIIDENDNSPVFEKRSYFAEITEGCPIGSYVADVRASDIDAGSNSIIKYAIAGGNYGNWFQISQATGLITTTSDAIDFDILDNSSIVLRVTATDLGNPPLQAITTVNITIQSVNDNIPKFNQTLFSMSINESFPVNSVIMNITATDFDMGLDGRIHYQFDHLSKLVSTTFFVNQLTGEISLQRKLDYDSVNFYSFYILATDSGNPQLHSKAQVQIAVTDIDDHSPIFSASTFHVNSIAQNLPGAIGTFRALDIDSGMYGEISYSLEVPGCCNFFTVDSTTGMVNSTRALNIGSKYELSIIASSNGKTTRAVISVVIVGNTSQSPLFSRDEYSFHVEENSPGRFVGKLELADTSRTVIFSIEAGNELGYFRINNKGELLTEGGIDREKHSLFVLTIIARTNQTLFLTAKATAGVTIKDLNDNKPVLIKQQLSGYSVREDAVIGDYICTVFATDADYGRNGIVRYSLQQESRGLPFEIDPFTGSVFLSKSLLNQSQAQYAVNVEMDDMGSPKQSTTARIFINVIDINDHSPEASATHYDVIVPRNLSVNSRFFRLITKDSDFGVNSKVLYKIQSGNTENTFGVFPSGWIYLKVPGISANIDYFLLKVVAYDQGSPRKSSEVSVSIFVEQIGAKRIFKSSVFRASVAENQPPNTLVTDLSNNVLSGVSNVSFRFLKASSYFNMQPKSGIVRTNVVIDREAISSSGNDTIVNLIVAEQNTTSNGSIKESFILIVEVSDANDNAPVFEKPVYNAIVNEARPSGTFVLKVRAADRDSPSTSNIVYKIQPAQANFRIDSSTGVIQVASSSPGLDYETRNVHNFTVVALDSKNSSLTSSCQVVVYVNDENDNKPVFTKSVTTLSLSESTAVGSSLFTFSASDKDSGINGFVTYSLSSTSAKQIFKINEYSGEMYLAGAVDFETKQSYDVTISATDHGSPALQETLSVRIIILDFNDNTPVFDTEPGTIFVSENVPLPYVIGRCSASDQDSGLNKVIKYTGIKQGPVPDKFTVDPSNCQISTNTPLDREQISAYYIIIKAEDSAQHSKERLSATKNITIIVEDLNDNVPVFVPPLAAGFSRTSATGWEIMKVSAMDPDAGLNGTITYSINQKLDSASFAINSGTGSVTVTAQLANDKKLFEIEVKASDGGSKEQKHSNAVFRFFVTGASSNAPVCSGTGQATVNENVAIGTNVYRIQAVSTEASSQMMYFIKSGNVANSFSIDVSTGWISTRRSIDYDSGTQRFNLIVFAVEKAGSLPKTTECTVRIDIQDVNDNAPIFPTRVAVVSVPENVKVGYEAYRFHATDKDSGQNGIIEYAITGGNVLSTFVIDAGTRVIKLAKVLDREVTPEYSLTIEASNKGSQKSYAQLTVKVSDVNDNVPIFNQTFYSFTVPESSPLYSPVGTVKATDADLGRNGEIYYEILDKDHSTFTIDHTTGVIRIAGIIDYELIPNFMLTIRAIDFGQPRLSSNVTVFVNLQDTNDNCPVFSRSVYTTSVAENLPSGTYAIKVSATDKDSGLNGQVSYEIVNGNTKDSFSVSTNGDVRTMRVLDREETPFFR